MFKKNFEIREHSGAIFSLAFDNQYIYSASADKFVTRWFPDSGKQDSFALKCETSIYKIVHFKNKNILIVGTSNGDIHIIDSQSKIEIKFLKYHQAAIFEICLDEINDRMYVGDANGILTVWNTSNWTLLISLPFECGKIRTIYLIDEHNVLIFGAQDGKIRSIDTNYFNLISSINAHNGGCLSLCQSLTKNSIIFSSGKDGLIKAWTLPDFKEIIAFPAHNEAIYKLVEHNGFLISASRDKTCKIWDAKTLDFVFKIDRKIGGHSHSINEIVIIDDQIFTAGDDKRIISWVSSFLN